MIGQFDPYHRWLGIPPRHQPPDCYRLLGIDRFEDDVEVIRSGGERQMRRVLSFEAGQHRELARKILDELARAKAVLLDDSQRAEYDRHLRAAAGRAPAGTEMSGHAGKNVQPNVPVAVPMPAELIPQLDARGKEKRPTRILGFEGTELRVLAKVAAFSLPLLLIFGTWAAFSFLSWMEQRNSVLRVRRNVRPVTLENPRRKQPPASRVTPLDLDAWPDRDDVEVYSDEPEGITAQPSLATDNELPHPAPDVEPSASEPTTDKPRTPVFTADQLDAAIEDARAAIERVDAAGGMDIADGRHRVQAAGLYKAFCQLAERATYVDPNEPQVEARLAAIDEILLDLGRQRAALDTIGHLAGVWIKLSGKRPENGILLAGTVMLIAPQGELFDTQVQLFAGKQPVVTVLSKNDPRDQSAPGDRVIILGVIVEDPAQTLDGYEGNLPQVIWAGPVVVLPE